MVSRGGVRKGVGAMMLVMVLLAATADLSRAEEATGASESPPSPPPAKDWSKTASGHGGVKLNPASAWTQYVMAGDVFYIRDDDWSSRIDTPPPEGVKEKGAGQDKSPKSWRGKVKDDL